MRRLPQEVPRHHHRASSPRPLQMVLPTIQLKQLRLLQARPQWVQTLQVKMRMLHIGASCHALEHGFTINDGIGRHMAMT